MQLCGLPNPFPGKKVMLELMKRMVRIFKDSYAYDKQRKTLLRNQDELEFLPAAVEILESPPSRFAHVLMLLICLFFIMAMTWCWFSHIDTEAVANGKVAPIGKVKNIQSLILGRVEDIAVKEGQFVNEGQLLVKLDPTESEIDSQQVLSQLLQTILAHGRLTLLLESINQHVTSIPALESWLKLQPQHNLDNYEKKPDTLEWQNQQQLLEYDLNSFLSKDKAILEDIKQKEAAATAVSAEIQRLEILSPLHRENENAVNSLLKKGHASRIDWLDAREKQVDISQQLEVQKSRLAEAMASLAAIRSEHDKFHKEFRQIRMEKLTELSDKLVELKLTYIKAVERDQKSYIKASVAGTVQQLSVFSEGSVVQPGSNLMIIVPDGVQLEVEAMIENKDIGFIKEGMAVDIKFETFPYTFYGYMQGTVDQISKDSIESPDHGMVYPVYIKLERQSVNINGVQQPLRVGMAVSAELKTGNRRLLEYFMDPFFRYRDETLIER